MATNIGELIERASRRHATRVAVVDGDRRLTFAEVGDRSGRLANALLATCEPGARVGLLLSNRLEFVEADFAIARAGMVKAPINPRLTDDERAHILTNCSAEVLITEESELERVAAQRDGLPDLRRVVVVGGADYADLLAASSPAVAPRTVDLDAPSMILHTSGTTGRPKGATTSQRSRLASMQSMVLDEYTPGVGDGMVHVAPMSHGSGSKILAFFTRGAKNLTLSKFDPATFFEAMRSQGGTSTFVVPTMIRMVLDADAGRGEIPDIRNITYGGSPMPMALAEEAIAAFGPVLTQVYGSCEAPHPVTSLSHLDHVADGGARLGSAGFVASGVEVRIVDADGRDVGSDEPGELLIRGANVMLGYWNDPTATDKVFVDGWYRSGDIAQRSATGLVSIVGREREMLISGGLNVYPAEVEAVLHRHDGVSEAAVFGMPDDLWGEVVAAAIVTRAGRTASAEDIRNHCMESLAGYKLPRQIFFVDELPKGNTGKVSKKELVALGAGGHA